MALIVFPTPYTILYIGLHPLIPPFMKVLFICLGNICRSPIAEEVFRQKVKATGREADFERIDSAGMIDYHEGELADGRMRQHAFDRGYRLTHRSRPMTTADFEEFDLILAMDSDNISRLRSNSNDNPELMGKVQLLSDYLTRFPGFHRIPDPYYGGAEDFELVIDLCEDACEQLLSILPTQR